MHYKESYPFQPIHLWLMPKSNIFGIVDVIVDVTHGKNDL